MRRNFDKDLASAQDVGRMGTLYHTLPRAAQEKLKKQFGPLIARKVPPYHEQYPKIYGWPAEANPAACRDLLYGSYAHASSQPWTLESAMISGIWQPSEGELVKRWHGTAAMKWISDKKGKVGPGSIVDWREDLREVQEFCPLIRSNFGNMPVRQEVVHLGTVHVAVGFNDLGMLLQVHIADAPEGKEGPLRFVGIDVNPFCIAKASVLVEMLRRPEAEIPLLHCLQVWYSSTWTRATVRSFKTAIKQVVTKKNPAEVNSYLNHWLATEALTLTEARKAWLATREGRTWSEISCLKQHIDQMMMCQYILTGDLLGGQSPEVGSLSMWSVPAGSPPNEFGENAFSAVIIHDLVGARVSSKDIVSCLVETLLTKLGRLRERLHENAVEVELRCARVAPGAPIIDEIAELRPWTMSWSNVLDYIRPSSFHTLARACSIHGDTLHFGYSMNWASEVFGTCLMDYDDLKTRRDFIEASHKVLEKMCQLYPAYNACFVMPPHANPLNFTAFGLGNYFHGKWVENFLKHAGSGPVQLGRQHLTEYEPLTTVPPTVTLLWTYDPEVSFHVGDPMRGP